MIQDVQPLVIEDVDPPDFDPTDDRVSIAPMSHPNLRAYPPAVLKFYEQNRVASLKYEEQLSLRKDWLDPRLLRPAANLCIDGRVQDFGSALGLPIGILEPYRSAGAISDLESDYYRTRRSYNLHKIQSVQVRSNSPPKAMCEMAMFTVHYSHSYPETASCAAWKHDTEAALANAHRLANQYNRVFLGHQAVGFPVLVDTDYDAITVIGPEGTLAVRDLLDDPEMQNGSCRDALVERLGVIFPESWLPLTRLNPCFRAVFHKELAERVECNLAFVRNVIRSNRPIELLDHQEKMVYVGRHADWIEDHNSIFLIDDTQEKIDVVESFILGVEYVTKNVLNDVMKSGDRDWFIPVIVNVPHEEEFNSDEAAFKARVVKDYLVKALRDRVYEIFEWVISGPNALKRADVPDWLFRQLHEELADRVYIATSVSYRKTRRLCPFL